MHPLLISAIAIGLLFLALGVVIFISIRSRKVELAAALAAEPEKAELITLVHNIVYNRNAAKTQEQISVYLERKLEEELMWQNKV